MNDTPQDAWFYSHEGERIGPVTFADLRIKAVEGGLNPRLDMVWKHGMGEWTASGEIEGLFERRAAPVERESLAPPADPYKPPQQESVETRMSQEGEWPGARRRSYLFMTFIFPALFSEGFSYGPPFLAPYLSPEMNQYVTIGCMFVPVILMICYSLMRLTNLGMSRWWFLAKFVPFLNLWVGYRCFACPAGYAYHKKLDGIGVFLAIIYWLSILIVVLAVAAVIALLFGAIGSPEMQEQIREGLRQANEMSHKK